MVRARGHAVAGGSGSGVTAVLPGWALRLAAGSAVLLLTGAALWSAVGVLARVALVTCSLAVAVLLAALLAPVAGRLRRVGVPAGLAALSAVLLLLAAPGATGVLIWSRLRGSWTDLRGALTAGVDQVRTSLVDGPLSLDPAQVGALRDTAVGQLQRATPTAVAGATTVLQGLAAALFVLFAVFFLLKDGPQMWRWTLSWAPSGRREAVDGAGREAWTAVTGYVRGIVLVATVDAVLIGASLLVLGVPLWLSLTLLTFFAAFVPRLGATVAGAAAVLVTLVTNDLPDALIVLAVVLVVQQVEGNVLHPLVVGRAVRLHPLAILVAVTCGTLLLGIVGAVLAVPVVAAGYRAVASLAHRLDPEPAEQPQDDPVVRVPR